MAVGLATVMVLTGFLLWKRSQRLPARYIRSDPSLWTGRGIDVTPLKPKVEDLRQNFQTAVPPAKGVCFHRAFLYSVRRLVAHFAYFQDRQEDHAHLSEDQRRI